MHFMHFDKYYFLECLYVMIAGDNKWNIIKNMSSCLKCLYVESLCFIIYLNLSRGNTLHYRSLVKGVSIK